MDLLPEVRDAIAPFVEDSGVCPEDLRTLKAINDARRILYPMGDWDGTTDHLCVKCQAHKFTLPSEYDYAKQAYRCKTNIVVENDWFVRMDGSISEHCGDPFGNLVKQPGQYVTFRDWPGCIPGQNKCCSPEGFRIELVFESENDCGVPIVFQGVGASRRQVSLTRVLTGRPFVPVIPGPKDERLVQLKHVIKPKMNGRVRVYGVDGANTILLALYDPDEINPHYTRYYNSGGGYSPFYSNASLITKVKKRYIKYEDNPEQFVDIHTEALIMMAQALTARKNKDTAAFSANVSLAAAFLQKQLGGPQSTSNSPVRWSNAMRVTGLIEG